MPSTGRPAPAQTDVLHDPHRVAAARRLFIEVYGHAAFDRLSGLAARLLGTGHAKVTLFTDQDTVVGGLRPAAGRDRRPGAADRGAVGDRGPQRRRRSVVPDAAADERVADLPAVTSGQVRAYLGAPLVAASGHVVGVAGRLRPRAAALDRRRGRTAPAARPPRVVAELELSAARSAIGTSVARLDDRAGGQLDRHLGARPAHRGRSSGTSAARRCSDSTAPWPVRRPTQVMEPTASTPTTRAAMREAMQRADRASAASTPPSSAR